MRQTDKNLTSEEKILYADDSKESVGLMVRLRMPWLLIGLVGGMAASFIASKFETLLSQNIALAFFIPFIVYMSGAVGTQTETIFVRNLKKGVPKFFIYVIKEFLLGLIIGLFFGAAVGLFAYFWIHSIKIAIAVGLAMFVNIAIAPVIALVIPEILFKEHTDPALGGGPFTTIIQDILSIVIYFIVASAIILTS